MGSTKGRGQRCRTPRATGTTARLRTRRGRRAGKFGKALQFNGSSALVAIPDAASLHLIDGMTLEAWVNPSTVDGNWRDVIYKGNDNYYLEGTSSNASKPGAGMIAGGSYAHAYGTDALPANSWSYLAETYDGSTLRLYVNGTQVASTDHTGSTASSTDPLQIGGDSIYGQYFAGLIDEVRVYNVALAAAQIQTDQATPVNPAPIPAVPSGLVAAYGFDEGSGTTVADASGNGNNGTITNATWAASGKYGKALQFNGTSALVTIPDAASLHLSTGDDAGGVGQPVDRQRQLAGRDLQGQRQLLPRGDLDRTPSRPRAGHDHRRQLRATRSAPPRCRRTRGRYLAETYDGSTLRLYVNGTQVASTAHTGTIATSTNPLQIGGDSIYGQYFDGLIDEVRVYNIALTAAQIQTDKTTAGQPPGRDTTPPSQPGTLTATAVSGGEVDLSWGAVDRQRRRHRLPGRALPGRRLHATSPRSRRPTGTHATTTRASAPATTYSYRVRATDAAGSTRPLLEHGERHDAGRRRSALGPLEDRSYRSLSRRPEQSAVSDGRRFVAVDTRESQRHER